MFSLHLLWILFPISLFLVRIVPNTINTVSLWVSSSFETGKQDVLSDMPHNLNRICFILLFMVFEELLWSSSPQ